jgi:magnesium-transporting ATPase (P-type)
MSKDAGNERRNHSDFSRDEIAKHIDTSSNAITAFAVLQGLTFVYTFGTNQFFNCLVKSVPYLAYGLIASFVVVTGLMVVAMSVLRRRMAEITKPYDRIVREMYRGKLAAVVVAALLPITITYWYGVHLHNPTVDCAKAGCAASAEK